MQLGTFLAATTSNYRILEFFFSWSGKDHTTDISAIADDHHVKDICVAVTHGT